MENAITHLLRKYYTISTQNYKVFYDFNVPGPSVKNITGALSLSGRLIGANTGNFYVESGLANFSGNSVYIDNSSGNINVQNCTYFLTYENKSLGDFSLVNCIETGSYNNSIYYKGYEFGVTANNHLYFNYYTPSGSQVFVSNEYMPDKSNVFLSLENNLVRFGSYDFVSQSLNLNSYPISSNYIFNPSGVWISSNLQYTNLYNSNKPFKGAMERVLVFSPSIPASDVRLINSGAVCDYYSGGNVVTYTSGIDITGYTTGLLPYFTGVTGTAYLATGVVTDKFGDTYSGYGQVNLTGVLYSRQILPQYGIVYIPNTGYVQDSITVSNLLINNYGKSNVNFLFDITSGENVNIVYNTGANQVSNQNNMSSSKANGFNYFSWMNSNKSAYEVWSNGLYQYSGKNIPSGDIYNLTNIISGDYIVDTNGNILFNNSFGIRDAVKVDIISPSLYDSLYIDNFTLGHSSLISSGERYYLDWPTNSQIFLNGQKLISGSDSGIGSVSDYGVSIGKIYFKNSGVFNNLPSSVLSAIIESGACDDVSQSNLIRARSEFLANSAKAYRNGVRLDNKYDYLELGNFDTNLGTGIFDIKANIIYNGNGGFN
jgi:hypothetical protein